MTAFTLLFAVLYGLVLAGLAAGLLAVYCARRLVRDAENRGKAQQERCDDAIERLRKDLAECVSQIQDVQREPVSGTLSAPRPGLNLSKRSQALRLHRRGDPPEQIATALSIPLQEVDLLLKVHRIFIGSL